MQELMAVAPVNTMVISGASILIKLILGVRVSTYRARHNIMWGDNGDDQMTRRIRAHANHSEWVPAVIIILALIEMAGVSPIIIIVLGLTLLVGRILHAMGLMGKAEAFNRVTGTVMTWLVLLAAALIAIIEYFAPGTF